PDNDWNHIMESGQTQTKPGRFVVGVDAGGTTVRLVLLNEATGHTVAEVQGGAVPDGGPEPLSELLRKALKNAAPSAASIEAVCSFLETWDPAVLAEAARRRAEADGRGFLVPLVLEAARSGDDEARNLYVGAAGRLAAQARSACARLDLGEWASLPVATIGG